MAALLAPRFDVLYVFVLSAVYVHLRGRVRHGFWRQLLDHSTLMAPYNTLMYLFSAVPPKPLLRVEDFPELLTLRSHWQEVRDEAVKMMDDGYIRAAAKHNDLSFNSFFRTGWKRFYIKWYDEPLPSATALCPRTTALVQTMPSIHAAMFALLPPGARLGEHRDPFAGSLRYHLGLVTPNSDQCRIWVDGQPYAWRDGEDVLFDETYIHAAENKTDQTRVILFCDVERPLRTPVMRAFNRWFAATIVRASATQNVEGERVGVLNRAFGFGYQIHLAGRRLKSANRTLYYAVKWALFGGIFYLILR